MLIAVFGDVHGNLPSMYKLCKLWEKKHKTEIDLVLQTGDMGIWKNVEQMDKATRRHYKKDESELYGEKYLNGKKEAFKETWFCHGNHENFELLRENKDKAIDPAGKIIFLNPGSIRKFSNNKQDVTIAALGGIEYRFGKYPLPSNEEIQKYLFPPAMEKLLNSNKSIDILLMHEAPLNKGLRDKFPTGSKRITQLIKKLRPKFFFYGHYDRPPEPFELDRTFCVGANQPDAKHIENRDGAMGILDTQKWKFDLVK